MNREQLELKRRMQRIRNCIILERTKFDNLTHDQIIAINLVLDTLENKASETKRFRIQFLWTAIDLKVNSFYLQSNI